MSQGCFQSKRTLESERRNSGKSTRRSIAATSAACAARTRSNKARNGQADQANQTAKRMTTAAIVFFIPAQWRGNKAAWWRG